MKNFGTKINHSKFLPYLLSLICLDHIQINCSLKMVDRVSFKNMQNIFCDISIAGRFELWKGILRKMSLSLEFAFCKPEKNMIVRSEFTIC